jgi:hypothetical protein
MKKLLLTLFTGTLFTMSAFAQGPPDFGFDLPWIQNSAGQPQGWASAKIVAPNVLLRDSLIFNFGVASAKITTSDVSLIAGLTNGLLPPTSGIMLTGAINFGTPPVKMGYPFTQRKDSLGFFARYQPTGVDTAFARVIFLKRNTQRDTIAEGYTKITSTNGNFELKYVEMVYNPNFPNTALPDSALIIFSSSLPTGAQIGSTLWVDDLKWGTINTGIVEAIKNESIKITPNPSNEYITIDFGNTTKASEISIIDVNGKLVESFGVNSKIETFAVGHLANGLYFYTVRDKNAAVLSSGKITVKH